MNFFELVEPSFGLDELEKFNPVLKFSALDEQNRSSERKILDDPLYTHVKILLSERLRLENPAYFALNSITVLPPCSSGPLPAGTASDVLTEVSRGLLRAGRSES